jgi:hypothetical protein
MPLRRLLPADPLVDGLRRSLAEIEGRISENDMRGVKDRSVSMIRAFAEEALYGPWPISFALCSRYGRRIVVVLPSPHAPAEVLYKLPPGVVPLALLHTDAGTSVCEVGAVEIPDLDAALRRSAQGATSAVAAPALPVDGPLDIRAAVALGLVARSTLYDLVKGLPPPITVAGAKKRSPRWPNRAAFDGWLTEALAEARRKLEPPPVPESARARKARRSVVQPAEGLTPLEALHQELRASRRADEAAPPTGKRRR